MTRYDDAARDAEDQQIRREAGMADIPANIKLRHWTPEEIDAMDRHPSGRNFNPITGPPLNDDDEPPQEAGDLLLSLTSELVDENRTLTLQLEEARRGPQGVPYEEFAEEQAKRFQLERAIADIISRAKAQFRTGYVHRAEHLDTVIRQLTELIRESEGNLLTLLDDDENVASNLIDEIRAGRAHFPECPLHEPGRAPKSACLCQQTLMELEP